MSILITGMEMPKCCAECVALHDDGNSLTCLITHEPRGYIFPDTEERMSNCPLVPVPEYGRLIDADAFCEKILEIVERQKYDDFYAESLSVGAILREVVNELNGSGLAGFSNAPTIIPADKEEIE